MWSRSFATVHGIVKTFQDALELSTGEHVGEVANKSVKNSNTWQLPPPADSTWIICWLQVTCTDLEITPDICYRLQLQIEMYMWMGLQMFVKLFPACSYQQLVQEHALYLGVSISTTSNMIWSWEADKLLKMRVANGRFAQSPTSCNLFTRLA